MGQRYRTFGLTSAGLVGQTQSTDKAIGSALLSLQSC